MPSLILNPKVRAKKIKVSFIVFVSGSCWALVLQLILCYLNLILSFWQIGGRIDYLSVLRTSLLINEFTKGWR